MSDRAAYMREWRQRAPQASLERKRAMALAQSRALWRLARMYPADYRRLYEEERGPAAPAGRPRQTVCAKGHSLADGDPNVYISPQGKRACRACLRAYQRERYEQKRGAA